MPDDPSHIMINRTDPATVAGAFTETAARHPTSPFLHVEQQTARAYDIPPGAITYSDAASQIAHLRAAYAAAGYGPGHRVGLMLDNRPAFFFHWLALNALGAAVVPLNSDLRPAELDYLVQHSEIVLGIAAAPNLPALRAAAPDLATIAADASPPPVPKPARTYTPDRTTECALLYTSGTTGRPKGCVLSNDYYLRAGHWYATIGGLCDAAPRRPADHAAAAHPHERDGLTPRWR